MKKLRELVDLASPNKTKTITIVGNGKKGSTKLHRLYQLIADGLVSNDEEAFQKLYPGANSKGSYYKLKHELSGETLQYLVFY